MIDSIGVGGVRDLLGDPAALDVEATLVAAERLWVLRDQVEARLLRLAAHYADL